MDGDDDNNDNNDSRPDLTWFSDLPDMEKKILQETWQLH